MERKGWGVRFEETRSVKDGSIATEMLDATAGGGGVDMTEELTEVIFWHKQVLAQAG